MHRYQFLFGTVRYYLVLSKFFYLKNYFLQFILFGAEVAKAVDKSKNEVASVTWVLSQMNLFCNRLIWNLLFWFLPLLIVKVRTYMYTMRVYIWIFVSGNVKIFSFFVMVHQNLDLGYLLHASLHINSIKWSR